MRRTLKTVCLIFRFVRMGQLTTEDEERRRRRRERNKVAATKCRNRKKERTGILMKESDVLEDQNSNFRSEIQRLENEKRRLMDVLAMHSPNCLKTGNYKRVLEAKERFLRAFALHAANSQTPVSCPSDFVQTNVNVSQVEHPSCHYRTVRVTVFCTRRHPTIALQIQCHHPATTLRFMAVGR